MGVGFRVRAEQELVTEREREGRMSIDTKVVGFPMCFVFNSEGVVLPGGSVACA